LLISEFQIKLIFKFVYKNFYALKTIFHEKRYFEYEKNRDTRVKILILYSEGDLNYRTSQGYYADKLDTILTKNLYLNYKIIRALKPPSNILNDQLLSLNKSYFISVFKTLKKGKNIFKIREKLYLNIYEKILVEINPKVVFSFDADKYLIKACQELSIKYVEVQHGVIDIHNEVIINAVKQNITFLVWNSFYEKLLREIGATYIIKIGIPSLYPSHFYNIFQKTILNNQSEKEILVLLSWKLSNSLDKYGTISNTVYSMVTRLHQDNPSIKFRVRPHPVSVDLYGFRKIKANIHNVLKHENITVENPWEVSINDSLNRTKFLIGYPSATLIEAAAKGLRCFFEYSNLFISCIDSELINRGYVTFFKEVDDSFLSKVSVYDISELEPYSDNLEDISIIARKLDFMIRK
jgi:hypothetical protein